MTVPSKSPTNIGKKLFKVSIVSVKWKYRLLNKELATAPAIEKTSNCLPVNPCRVDGMLNHHLQVRLTNMGDSAEMAAK